VRCCQALQLPAFGLQVICAGLVNMRWGESATDIHKQSFSSRIMQVLGVSVLLVIGTGLVCISGPNSPLPTALSISTANALSDSLLSTAVFAVPGPSDG
jgi:hypothetical protein